MTYDPDLVVFVCEHGAVKSVIAAALFNRLSAERGLSLRAVSRGTVPDDEVPALVRDNLCSEGAYVVNARPMKLNATEGLAARLFVAFDVDVPVGVSRGAAVRRWDATPSVMSDYCEGRDAIAALVSALVAEMDRGSGSGAP